jgi:hypothetical protein
MANTLDTIIKNFIDSITGGSVEEDTEVAQPKQGLMASVRPKARPTAEDEDINTYTPTKSVDSFINKLSEDAMATVRPIARPTVAIDANMSSDKLYNKYITPAYKFIGANKNNKDNSLNVAVDNVIDSENYLDDLMIQVDSMMDLRGSIRPRAKPKSLAEIQAIEKEQRSYTEIDSTKDLQVALNAAGITVNGKPLVEDGIMGNNTKKAIKAFQKREGLKVDGIAGPNTKQALRSVAPYSPIVESLVFDTRPSVAREGQIAGENRFSDALINKRLLSLAKDKDVVEEQDVTESDGLMSRPSVAREGQISGEGALDQFASSSAPITSERLLGVFVNEDGEDVYTPRLGSTRTMLLNLGFLPKMLGGLLSPDITDEVKNLNPVEKVKSLGYIKNQYANILTSPSADSLARIGADIRDGRYGGYATNLDENNPDHAKTIEQFFREAIGKKDAKFNAREEAWCALFVDHVLNQMDVDRLGSGQGADLYDRVRARAYEGYGEGVLGKSPTVEEFNSNSKQGDIVVLKSSFKVIAKGDKKFYDKEGNVRLDNNGNPAKAIWISSNVMDKNKDGTYFAKDSSDDILQNELDTYTSGGYSIQPQYHVGFSMGKAKNGYVRMLGGNQQNQVNVRGDAYAVENIMAVRRITSDTIDQEIN